MTTSEHTYGSVEWLEAKFKGTAQDPWGLGFRAIEQCRYRSLISLLKQQRLTFPAVEGAGALDVGCATGDFSWRLRGLTQHVVGIDCSVTAIARAKAKYPALDWRVLSLPDPSLASHAWKLVTCCECLYYMEDHQKRTVLQEIRRLLTRDGMAVFTSLIGDKPYFQPDQLAALLAEQFDVVSTHYYGSRGYANCEGAVYTAYCQLGRVRAIMKSEASEQVLRDRRSTGTALAALIIRVSRIPILGVIVDAALLATARTSRAAVGPASTLVARLANSIAEAFSMRRTHTVVLVRPKRPEGSATAYTDG